MHNLTKEWSNKMKLKPVKQTNKKVRIALHLDLERNSLDQSQINKRTDKSRYFLRF